MHLVLNVVATVLLMVMWFMAVWCIPYFTKFRPFTSGAIGISMGIIIFGIWS